MSIVFHCRLLPLLATLSIAAACTDGDDPPKLVSVANQTSDAHTVLFGDTRFGSIPASTTSAYMEVDDGTNAVLVDGRQMWRDSLGSDNVGGSWTLYLQSVSGQLIVGVSLDE
jgi:hypothetical protein